VLSSSKTQHQFFGIVTKKEKSKNTLHYQKGKYKNTQVYVGVV
jgi:hypothetical protein